MKRNLKQSQLAALGILLVSLAGCRGSASPGPGDTVDYRDYALPSTSGVHEIDKYTVDNDGNTVFLERQIWQFTVSAGHVVLVTDSGESHVTVEESALIFDPGTAYEFTVPRTVQHGDVFSDADGQQFALFGPYQNYTFTVYGTNVQRQDASVLVEVYRRQQDEFSDIYLQYYAKGIGVIGVTRHEYCPLEVPLDISANYDVLCEDTLPGRILVSP